MSVYSKSKCILLLFIKDNSLKLDYLLSNLKKLGLIWSYILKVMKFIIFEYLSCYSILGYNLKRHYFSDYYALLKNNFFCRLFSSIFEIIIDF